MAHRLCRDENLYAQLPTAPRWRTGLSSRPEIACKKQHGRLLHESTYRYEPLDTTKQQIRLLRLQTTHSSPVPCCEISIFDLRALPAYIALSYTWDDDKRPKGTIQLNDKKYSVGQTLCAFFRHFQESLDNTGYPWLWIDQICINQSEVREKNHQIPLMSLIYTRCSHVVAWLGPTFTSFEALLNDRYFTRLWIVQEILLAPEVRILCGDSWIMWSDLQESIATDNAPSWTDVQPVTLSLILDHGQHGSGKSLCHYINYYSAQDCRDPRDKLYGLLGLVPEDQRPTVDYAKSTIEVFTDAARAIYKEYRQQETKLVRPTEIIQACLELFSNMNLPRRQPKQTLLSLFSGSDTVDYTSDVSMLTAASFHKNITGDELADFRKSLHIQQKVHDLFESSTGKMHKMLQHDGTLKLVGLGGTSRTQLALEYVMGHKQEHPPDSKKDASNTPTIYYLHV